MNNRLLGSASANTCSGGTLCGLQSRVVRRSNSDRVAASRDSGRISPRATNPDVHLLGWQPVSLLVAALSGSVFVLASSVEHAASSMDESIDNLVRFVSGICASCG